MPKTFLITGASQGMGRAIAEKLIAEGHSIIGIARHFTWQSEALLPILLDLSNLSHLAHCLSALKKQISRLNGIICCSGSGRFGSLEEFSYEQIRELIDLNFLSQVYIIKTFLPLFKQNKEGDVVLIGSEAALRGTKQGTIYCASKFALRGFCQALREECSSSGIRVTLINPGMVKTNFFDKLHFSPGESFKEHILPEDVAELVAYILKARSGTVFDEINLSPQAKKIIFK